LIKFRIVRSMLMLMEAKSYEKSTKRIGLENQFSLFSY